MKIWYSILSLCILISFGACKPEPLETAVRSPEEISLVPKPQSLKLSEAKPFIWTTKTSIYYTEDLKQEAAYLQDLFQSGLGSKNEAETLSAERQKDRGVVLKLGYISENPEAYQLSINSQRILIEGASPAGVMRAIQSLRQLLIPEFFEKNKRERWAIPSLEITDYPAFKHRGMLLDVCRHFFDVETVKKYIDLLALYKMNVLHLHLTEDQGWRMESEKWPKLNSISSWRIEEDGSRYGGYYTKDQLKQLVAYAAERHIRIIPEIELPGHSQAALAAYPQFSCLGAKADIKVVNDWGVFKEIYCAGNDSTFLFLQSILEEVMEIFPSEYIHIGGDEAPKFRWENCAKCQHRMQNEVLHDEHELQSYFIQRIEKFLNKNGRKLIGWDEILEGGLSANATVQSWRGIEGGIAAARSGHYAIMSPTSHCYLDYGLERIDLQKIYNFDPIPEELSPEERAYILGAECNMWTEHVPNAENLDYKVNPRMQGLAEVLWTYPQQRDFSEFFDRMQGQYPILEALDVTYGPEALGASIYAEVYPDSNKVFIGAKRSLELLNLEVRWNGVKGPWGFDLVESGTLQAQAFKKGKAYGDSVEQKFAFHKALARETKYKSKFEKWYSAGGELALVNGTLGSINFRDGQWQGFSGKDVELQIDLGSLQDIQSVSSNFYHYNNAWIFRPELYEVAYSADGKKWQTLGTAKPSLKAEARGQHLVNLKVKAKSKARARYLKIRVKSILKVPDWHEAAGSEAWVFIDEVIVE